MLVDVADLNGDALPEIVVLDMLPEDNERQKSMLGFMNYNKFQLGLRQGYLPQFVRNTLQVHNGTLHGELLPFSEVSYLAGIERTDWSWTPLLADFDNDGDRDLYVTNGYGKDITDLDFVNYSQQLHPFGSAEDRQVLLFDAVRKMPSITRTNYVFENRGDLHFEKRDGTWIQEPATISNGAVYADLDADGDLDLVVNNLNGPAHLLENQAVVQRDNHYLKIKLNGPPGDPHGTGTIVRLWANGQQQRHYQSPVRGYLSSVSPEVHFGLGESRKIDSITVEHPRYGSYRYVEPAVDQLLEVDLTENAPLLPITAVPDDPLFQALELPGLTIDHRENVFSDFDAQPLLLRQLSRQGPCLAAADLDGRPGDELFVGGARGTPGRIFTQQPDGIYTSRALDGEQYEDTAATFVDLDGDGDLDLYVVSGGTEIPPTDDAYQDRIYLNDGQGRFAQSEQWRSPAVSSGSCVVAADYDQDGDVDLFVGGRVVPGRYPEVPRSYLLVNHNGRLLDMTTKLAYHLETPGMITDAVWSDFNADGRQDLIVVGEWLPVLVYLNEGGHLHRQSESDLSQITGLWTTIAAADFDGDGDEDYLVGNQGQNTRLRATADEPLYLLTKDYDGNGSPDPLLGRYDLNQAGERRLYPLHARDDVVRQLTTIKDRFGSYEEFGRTDFTTLLSEAKLSEDFLSVSELSSIYLENKGGTDITVSVLPREVQWSRVQNIEVADYNGDGFPDALLSGNDYTGEKTYGWQDAGNGLLILGDGRGGFRAVPTVESGFLVSEDGRDVLRFTDRAGKRYLAAAQNGSRLLIFQRMEGHTEISKHGE